MDNPTHDMEGKAYWILLSEPGWGPDHWVVAGVRLGMWFVLGSNIPRELSHILRIGPEITLPAPVEDNKLDMQWPICPNCGAMMMIKVGSTYRCTNCREPSGIS